MMASTVTLICERCEEQYERHESNVENSRFCSNACRYRWDEQTSLSSNRSVERDDVYWQANRRRALTRDSNECQICEGSVGRISESGDKKEAHVHHRLPLSHGGTHELDNLQTLCKDCHQQIHANGRSEAEDIGYDQALLTAREREIIAGDADVSDDYRYQTISRIRKRLGRLEGDMEALAEHGDLLTELQEIVCDTGENG